MRRWIVLVLAGFSIACLMQTTATAIPSPEVEVGIEEPFIEPTATPMCQHSSKVTLNVRRINDSSVELRVNGLQPGEVPYVIHSTSLSGVGGTIGESGTFVEGADENGEFLFMLTGLRPLKGQSSATWDIRFIHIRGVECATITLP